MTELLGGTKNATVNIITKVNGKELDKLKKDIQDCNTTAQVDVVIKEHGLSDIEGLPQHIKELYEKGEIGKLKTSDVNNFINNQKYKNIANQAHGILGVNTAIKEYNEGIKEGTLDTEKFVSTINTSNSSLGKYLTNLKGAEGNIFSYVGSLATATLKTFALEAATTALNTVVSFGISLLIDAAFQGISYLITYEKKQKEAFENAKTATEECAKAIKDIKSEMSKTSTKANELSSEFATLVQGVDPMTNKNENLSTDQYERFLDVNNQLAELFPSLTKNYDKNGNAIFGLSGDVDSVTASIARLVEQQNNLAKSDMRDKLDEYVNGTEDTDGVFKALKGFKNDVGNAQEELDKLKTTYENIINGSGVKYFSSTNGLAYDNYLDDIKNKFGQEAYDLLYKATTQGTEQFGSSYTIDFSKLELDEVTKGKITESYNTFYQDLQTDLSVKTSELEAKNQEMSNMMMLWVEDLDLYKNSGNESFKRAIESVVGSIQWSELDVQEGNIDEAKQLLQSLILTPLTTACNNPDTKLQVVNSLNSLFSIDFSKLSYKEANKKIQDFLTIIMNALNAGLPDDKKKSLLDMYEMFGLGDYDKTTVEMKNNLTSIAKEGTSDYQKLADYTKGFTKEQTEAWLSATNGATNAEDAIKRYESSLKSSSNAPKSFNEIWKNLDSDDDLKEEKEKVEELAEAGKLTEKEFKKSSIAAEFTEAGYSISEATKKINGFIENVKQLNSMKTGISAITSAYDEKKDASDKRVGTDTLDSMYDTLGVSDWEDSDLKVWEQYKKVASSSKSTLKDLKVAQDDLATSFVNSNNFLTNITDGTYDYYVGLLREMGVTNAATVATEALNKKKVESKLTNFDLKNATEDEISELGNYISGLDGASDTLVNYTLKKQIAGGALDTSGSIQNLINLATQCGATTKVLEALKMVLNATDDLTDAKSKDLSEYNTSAVTDLKHIGDDLQKQKDVDVEDASVNLEKKTKKLNKLLKGAKTALKTSEGNPDKGGSKNKSSKDKSTQVIDWISRRLEVLQSVIDRTSAKFNNLFTYTKKKNNINNQIKETISLLNAQYKAADKYQTKADRYAKKSGLNKKIISKIQNGSIKGDVSTLIKAYGENKANKITKLQDYIDKAKDARDATDAIRKSIYDLNQQKLDLRLEYNEDNRSLYDAKIENSFTASGKNALINKKINTYNGDDNAYSSSVKNGKSQLKKDKKSAKSAVKSSNLSDSLKKRIQSFIKKGKLIPESVMKQVAKKTGADSTLYSKLAGYNSSVDFVSDAIKNQALAREQNQTNIREAKIEQHQNLVDEQQSALDRYSAEKEIATTAASKNSYIDSEKASTETLYNEKIEIANLEGNINESLQLQAEKTKALRDLEIERHQNIADEYQSSLDLYTAQKDNLKTASDKNKVVDQEKQTTKQLYAEKIAIAGLEGNITEQLKLQEELSRNLVALEKEKFDNTSHYYENLRKLNNNSYQDLSNASDELEARGLIIGSSLYSSQIALNDVKKKGYEDELYLLEQQLPNIEEGTDEWYEALDAIQACENGIADTTKNTIELSKSVREIPFLINEKIKSRLELISSEFDLIIKYMSNKKLTDNGTFTKEGTATLAAYYSQLLLVQEEINELYPDIEELWKKIQAGEEGYTDPAVLDEFYEKYPEYIELKNNEYDVQQSLIDLMKDKYEEELDYLQDIIDKRKELLQAEKDAYDYQRTIEEKTSAVSVLKKQLNAISGDDSEESKIKRQQLLVSLDEAQKDLQDTEYNKWISDQQEMLDKLYTEYADFIDDHLNETEKLLDEAIAYLNDPSTTTTFLNIWDKYMSKYNFKPESDLKCIVDKLGENSPIVTAINSVANQISTHFKKQKDDVDAASEVIKKISEIGTVDYDGDGRARLVAAERAYDSLTLDQKAIVDSASMNGTSTLQQKQKEWLDTIPKTEVTNSQQAQQDDTQNNQLKQQELDRLFKETYWQYGGGTNIKNASVAEIGIATKLKDRGLRRDDGLNSPTNAVIADIMNRLGYSRPESQTADALWKYMQNIGYSSGGVADYLQKVPGMNGDDGWVTLKKGEAILTPEQTKQFQKLTENLDVLNPAVNILSGIQKPNFDLIPNKSITQSVGDINIQMDFPNVTNYEEFRHKMQSDPKIEKMFKSMIWDKGDLSKYKISL